MQNICHLTLLMHKRVYSTLHTSAAKSLMEFTLPKKCPLLFFFIISAIYKLDKIK